jgi:hypothetical protein
MKGTLIASALIAVLVAVLIALLAAALIAVLAAALIAVSVPIATVVAAAVAAAAVAAAGTRRIAHLAFHEADELWGRDVAWESMHRTEPFLVLRRRRSSTLLGAGRKLAARDRRH